MSKARDIADLLDSAGKVTADDLDVGAIGGRRNLIINGAMQVAQRGTSLVNQTASNKLLADKWRTSIGGASYAGSYTVEVEVDAPVGFKTSLKTTQNTATANANEYVQRYFFEAQDMRCAYGSNMALSFWYKSNRTGSHVVNYANAGISGAVNGKLTFTVNAADTWEHKTLTISSFASATGDSLSDTGWGWHMDIGPHMGGVGIMPDAGAYFQFTGVQLELGSVATPFEHRSYGEELALCQRYYWRTADGSSGGAYLGTGGANATGSRYCDLNGRAEMRATPTIGLAGSIGDFEAVRWGTDWDTATSWTVHMNSPQTTNLVINTGVIYTNGYASGLRATSTSFFYADAEL